MSSTNKTPNLGLNNWAGSDRPQRADFNSDNLLLDTLAGGHIKNGDIHVTAAEKEKWNGPVAFSMYFGTNADSREIKLGYQPTAVFVYPQDMPMLAINFDTRVTECYFGAAGGTFNSRGISITSDGFNVRNNYRYQSSSNDVVMLNKANTNYIFLAWK